MPGTPARLDDPATTDAATWRAWAAARDAELASPHGWLSLTALHWLGPAPAALGDLPGTWWADADGIHVDPGTAPDPGLTLDAAPVTAVTTVWTADAGATGDLRHGDRRLEPLGRGPLTRGVRVRDPHAPALRAFTGVPRFDHDPAWRLTGTFVPAEEGLVAETGSVAAGVRHVQAVAGHVRFTSAGAEHVLQVAGGAHPAIWFRDATNGHETAAFRVLAVRPEADGTVVLDLNRAENAPCAFSDHGTCPLPPAGNTLPFAVRAGERTPTGR
ncbi:DUF1684 domain-containing protein [Cellulomonas hominis]|uniref:DUF1684 domain-containing protein n=1 Tax=Cellulomonas hominis TaxID=156981 RepID=UPI001BA0F006|nr:DUF1684 domain-containing protein [Cellulomonas hominis]VTR78447.1 hypothetical protein CHMI_03229 [Cellulomonas hominis]